MRRRSSNEKCLLCLANCLEDEEEKRQQLLGVDKLPIVGAGGCNQLREQLEKIFVLRKIFEIPQSWCQQLLSKSSPLTGNVNECDLECGRKDVGPANWFAVCNQCMNTSVAEAWKIHQQIIALEAEMLSVKKRIMKTMKKELFRPKNKNWVQSQRGEAGSVQGEIINFVFPKKIIPTVPNEDQLHNQVSEVEDGDGIEDDVDWVDENVDELDGISDGDEDEIEIDDITNYIADDDSWMVEYDGELESNSASDPPYKNKRARSTLRTPGKKRIRKKQSWKDRKRRSNGIWFSCHEPKCMSRFHNQEDLDAHNRAHEERVKREADGEKSELDCPHCSFAAVDMIQFSLHVESRHRFENRIYHFSCPKCDFKVQDIFPALKAHFNEKHPLNPLSQSSDNKPLLASEQPINCPVCSKRLESLKTFTLHQRSMHPEQMGIELKTLQCDQCEIKFTTEVELQIHQNNKHNPFKEQTKSRFVCEECGEGFQYAGRLERHKIKHVNKSKRDHICHLCGLDYAYKWLLDDHYRKLHPAQKEGKEEAVDASTSAAEGSEEKEKCKYCDFTCGIRGIMIRHLQQHKAETGFKCNLCAKSYVSDAGLKRHKKINHAPKQDKIPCPYCMKPFISMDYMRHHVRTYCKLKKLEQNQPDNIIIPSPEVSSSQSYPLLMAVESIKFDAV